MTKQDILQQVVDSNWQPEFEFTDDLDSVVDSILKPHEDYFLGLHNKVKEIIEREIDFATSNENHGWYNGYYKITFADVCNWQKELFDHKKEKINNIMFGKFSDLESTINDIIKVSNLPNQYINLGLRTVSVKVGNWIPPHPMFLEDFKQMCFPIEIQDFEFLTLPKDYDNGLIYSSKVDNEYFKYWITEWYKVFETIHFFEDLNGRIGGIVINILSYLLTGKYLIDINYEKI